MTDDVGVHKKLKAVGLPNLVFMFTIDQIASMINVSEASVQAVYLFYQGRSSGQKKRHMMTAVNIAPDDQKPDWRVSLEELRLWLRRMGFRTTDTTRF